MTSFGPGRPSFGPGRQATRPKKTRNLSKKTLDRVQAAAEKFGLVAPGESFWGPEITAAIEAERERDRQLAETARLREEQLARKKAAQRERLEELRRRKAEERDQ